MNEQRIAVLIPCYNESVTIAKVVHDFRSELPYARICVFDNNSTDDTIKLALSAGAEVYSEKTQGKGAVVRSMFSKIDADIYIMVDGDDQCPADAVHSLIEPVLLGSADMVIGDRISNGIYAKENTRFGHEFGNHFVRFLVNKIYNSNLKDIMSGYRVFSRKFAKNFPVQKNGFEIETEITLHALDNNFEIVQIPIAVRDRPKNSKSSMNTIRDGLKVILTILEMFKNYKPLTFFSMIAFMLAIIGIIISIPVFYDFIYNGGYITHVPLAILASGIEIIAVLSFFTGLILDVIVNHNRRFYALRIIDYQSLCQNH